MHVHVVSYRERESGRFVHLCELLCVCVRVFRLRVNKWQKFVCSGHQSVLHPRGAERQKGLSFCLPTLYNPGLKPDLCAHTCVRVCGCVSTVTGAERRLAGSVSPPQFSGSAHTSVVFVMLVLSGVQRRPPNSLGAARVSSLTPRQVGAALHTFQRILSKCEVGHRRQGGCTRLRI